MRKAPVQTVSRNLFSLNIQLDGMDGLEVNVGGERHGKALRARGLDTVAFVGTKLTHILHRTAQHIGDMHQTNSKSSSFGGTPMAESGRCTGQSERNQSEHRQSEHKAISRDIRA